MALATCAAENFGINWPSLWGASGTLKVISDRTFVFGGKTYNAGRVGDPLNQNWCVQSAISVVANVGTFASWILPQTDTGITVVNGSGEPTYTGIVYDASGTKRQVLFSNWRIGASLTASFNFESLAIYNASVSVINPRTDFLGTDAINNLITARLNAPATTTQLGLVEVDTTPVDTSTPIAIGTNSRRAADFYSIITYGALTTNTAAQNTTAIAAAVTAASAAGGGIYIPAGTFPCNTISITVPVMCAPGGSILRPAAGQTITLSKAFYADTSQHFSNATAGLGTVLFSGLVGVVQASWFGNCATELGAPLNAAIASIATVGGRIKIPVGALTQTVSVNATGLSNTPIIISGEGAGSGVGTTINCQLTGVGFDFTGSQFMVAQDFVLSGNQTTTPSVGFLFARKSTGDSAGENNMIRVKTLGYFTVAPLYNYASEDFLADTCSFTNNQNGAHSAIISRDNVSSVASAYQTIASGVRSSLDIRFTHCRLYNYSATVADALFLRGPSGFSFTDGFILQNQRAFVHIDASTANNANLNFKNIVLDAGGNGPMASYGWLITGTNQVAYLSLENIYDIGTFNTNAGGAYTAITNANPAVVTTTSAHGLTSGQTIAITGALSTLGAAINGPRVVTVLSSTTFSIPVNTTALSVYSGSGASGGGRNFYAEPGSNVLEVRMNQINGTQGSNAPYLFMYSADHCELDVAPGGSIEVAANLDPSFTSANITNSTIRVPFANFTMARSDLCKYNTVMSRNLGIQIVGILMQGEGAALSISSNTIAPTNSIHQVGAGLIKTITVPAGFTSGTVALVGTAAFTYDATGNVLGTGTATIGRTMMATYSASTGKWSMSY